jgi:hypothetical protein
MRAYFDKGYRVNKTALVDGPPASMIPLRAAGRA